jgi:hypothetical protein
MGKCLRNLLLAGVAVIGLASCKPCIPVKPNVAPIATAYSSKSSIKIGESILLAANGSDEDGTLTEYRLGHDKNKDGDIDDGEELSKGICPIIDFSFTPEEAGTHNFIAECTDDDGATSVANTSVVVSPSNLPTVNLTGINTSLDEEGSKEVDLPTPLDDDTSGEIPYISAVAEFGNVTPTLLPNGKLRLSTNGLITQNTPYKIILTFGTPQGGIGTASLEGTVQNFAIIKGRLQDNETDTDHAGEVRLYNASRQLMETRTVGSDGVFNFQIDPCTSVYLQAIVEAEGFVRTLTLDGTKDYSNLIVRPIPINSDLDGDGWAELDFNHDRTVSVAEKEAFKEFLRRVNFDFETGMYTGLKRLGYGEIPNGENFEGLEILYRDPITGRTFTEIEQNYAKNIIRTLTYLKAAQVQIQIDTSTSEKHYVEYSDHLMPNQKWGIIIPSSLGTGIAGATDVYDTEGNGYINRFRIKIASLLNKVILHELLHGTVYFGHSSDATHSKVVDSIMAHDGGGFNALQPADIKGIYVVEELTYPVNSKIEEILGMNWMN